MRFGPSRGEEGIQEDADAAVVAMDAAVLTTHYVRRRRFSPAPPIKIPAGCASI